MRRNEQSRTPRRTGRFPILRLAITNVCCKRESTHQREKLSEASDENIYSCTKQPGQQKEMHDKSTAGWCSNYCTLFAKVAMTQPSA